jgi:hypothetical protein
METKIKIKIGEIEIEFQGSEDFIKDEMPKLLTNISEIATKHHFVPKKSDFEQKQIEDIANLQTSKSITGTTNSIAAKLKVQSGPDLVMAAAAHLTFVKGQDKFHRKDLLESIKSASTYFKKSYANNLSTYLDSLQKSHSLTEQASDVYAIPADVRQKLELSLG